MRCSPPSVDMLTVLTVLTLLTASSNAAAQTKPADKHELRELFDAESMIRNDLQTSLTGRIAVPEAIEPGAKPKPPKVVAMVGRSRLVYDEVHRGSDGDKNLISTRLYRELSIQRKLGDTDQGAEVRPAVRRVVVLRSSSGKKNPFSPDGALTLNEIEVLRRDLVGPALVTGLLPSTPAKPGQSWLVGEQTVRELTDYETISENKLVVTFDGVLTLAGRNQARLSLKGTVRGVGEDGPSAQTMDGTLYFDLESKHLASLSFSAVSRIPAPDGKTTAGEIKGTFLLNRTRVPMEPLLSLDKLATDSLKLTDTNSAVLADEPELGLSFEHSRRWRTTRTTERGLTLEERSGAGVVTFTRTAVLPTATRQIEDAKAFAAKQNWKIVTQSEAKKAGELERFHQIVDDGKQRLRLDYLSLPAKTGGWIITARIPEAKSAELAPQFEALIKTLKVQ